MDVQLLYGGSEAATERWFQTGKLATGDGHDHVWLILETEQDMETIAAKVRADALRSGIEDFPEDWEEEQDY